MRVLVTGGTGYVGAFTVKALIDAGHTPRLLVRNRDRLAKTVGRIGVDIGSLDVVEGDMTDAAAVTTAVKGMDAVVHCAAVVAALDRSNAEATIQSNVNGTHNVVGAALVEGCDPVIHTSSIAALYDPREPVIHAELPPATHAESPYTKSKAICEAYVRDLQADGKPVVIIYPGGVGGPAAGEAFGDMAEGFISMLKSGVVPLSGGAITVIDVRDLAEVMVAALRPGRGARRYMVGGDIIDMHDLGRLLRAATGRRFPVLPLPGILFRTIGKLVDLARKVVPFDSIYTAEAMDLLTLARPTDDSAVHTDLGITYRPHAETFDELIRGLYANGKVTAGQVGTIANA
jgi:nucleoside-diphosphate-sugar epimerase